MDIIASKIADKLSFNCEVTVLDCVDSTNNYAKNIELKNESAALVVAKRQTAGKGRLGKSFFSPESGIYMSLKLKKSIPSEDGYIFTVAAATAVAEYLNEQFNIDAKIKWVNDVYCGSRKLSGILCEASVNADGFIDESIIGIGLNVGQSDFPCEISDTAVSLAQLIPNSSFDKNAIITGILNRFYRLIFHRTTDDIVNRYKRLSLMFGKNITVITPSSVYPAHVLDIDNRAGLVIKDFEGNIKTLNTGDVSIKF